MDSPFPGLRSYRVAEADWFFGRDGMSDAMALRLAKQRFLAVVGESGCGKSSLVRAGLIPTLQGGLLAEAGSRWRILDTHPGSDPLGALSSVLKKAGFTEGTDKETLARNPAAIAAARKTKPGADNLLILVDQFEELFRFSAHRDDKAAFLQLLHEAAAEAGAGVYVILTMRSDFIGMSAQFRGLPEQINQGLYLVPRMTRDNLRQAIEGPVRLAGAEIESKLVQTLLNEVGSEPDQLPVLQHALMRTWNNWVSRGNADDPVREDPDYVATGRLQGALSQHADEALQAAVKAIGAEAEALARRVFVLLRDRDVNGQEVRRPASVSEMCRVTGADAAKIRALVEEFRRPGGTFLNASPEEWADEEAYAGVEYDVTHESFIRKWARMRDQWIPAELVSRRIYARLAQQALDWDPKNPGYMDGAVLDQSLEWAAPAGSMKPTAAWAARYSSSIGNVPAEELFQKAIGFLNASRAERDRRKALEEEAKEAKRKAASRQTKKRLAYAASGVLLVAAVAATLMARSATKQKEHATALSIASSALLSSQDPWQATRAALLAGESLRRENTLLAAAVLSRSLNLIPKPLPALRHQGAEFISYNQDGEQIGTAGTDGVIQLWSSADGTMQRKIPSGRKIEEFDLVAGHALIYSEDSGVELLPLNGGEAVALCGDQGKDAVSSNGLHIVTHCGESLVLANLEGDRAAIRSIPLTAGRLRDLEISPDFLAISDSGKWVAAGRQSGGILLLQVDSRKLTGPVELGDLAALGFTGDDQVAAVREAGTVRRWDPSDASASADDFTLQGFGRGDRYLARFAGSRGMLVLQHNDRAVFAWSITGEPLAEADAAGGLKRVAASSGEVAVIGENGVARRWALPALVEPPFRGGIAFFSPDGKWLVQRSGSTYRLVSTVTRASESVNFNTAGFYPVAFAPGGDRVAVRVRQPAPGGPPQFPGLELRTFENGRIGAQSLTPTMRAIGNLAAAAFSPDGSALVTVHLNRGAELGWVMNAWDTRTGRQIGRRAMARVRDIVFSFDGKTVFCDDGANLQAWKLAEDRLEKVNLPAGARPSRWTMAEHRGLAACVMSRRSGGAAGGKADTEVRSIEVWEYPGWKRVVQLEIDEPISELSFSNDAALLFSSTPDGTFRIWDWQQRSQVGSIATQDPVLGMGYRADQRLVALQAGRLRSYLWREEDLKDALCKAAGRQLTLAEWKGAQLEEAEFPKKPLCPPPANVEE